jgi:hypothetical protein
MSQTLTSNNRTITLPNYANDGFREQIRANATKNYALDDTLYVDFISLRNGWTIRFDILTRAQYNEIRDVYNDQFSGEELLTFVDTDLSINAEVYMSLPDERNIKWNKTAVEGLTIVLEPRNAVLSI